MFTCQPAQFRRTARRPASPCPQRLSPCPPLGRSRRRVGWSGEITSQARVLPIGGLKQKVLAAHRAGLTEVILPKRNGPDLEDVPENVREAMTFHLADTYADVLGAAFAS